MNDRKPTETPAIDASLTGLVPIDFHLDPDSARAVRDAVGAAFRANLAKHVFTGSDHATAANDGWQQLVDFVHAQENHDDEDDPAAAFEVPGLNARDATHFRGIIAARKRLGDAEQDLRDAVAAAREAGDSWTVIGAALDVSKQAAYQRFGK